MRTTCASSRSRPSSDIRWTRRCTRSGPPTGVTVRVTSSHSVFVHEDGQVRLKRGDELKLGDRVVAPARIRLPEDAPQRIDLLEALWHVPQAATRIWLRGPAVVAWHKHAALRARPAVSPMTSPRVEIPAEVGESLAEQRRARRRVEPCAVRGDRHTAARHVLCLGERCEPTDRRAFRCLSEGHRCRRCRDPCTGARKVAIGSNTPGRNPHRLRVGTRCATACGWPISMPTTWPSSPRATTSR